MVLFELTAAEHIQLIVDRCYDLAVVLVAACCKPAGCMLAGHSLMAVVRMHFVVGMVAETSREVQRRDLVKNHNFRSSVADQDSRAAARMGTVDYFQKDKEMGKADKGDSLSSETVPHSDR